MRSMFVGVQVAVEGEGWMVRAIDKCYYCTYERKRLPIAKLVFNLCIIMKKL